MIKHHMEDCIKIIFTKEIVYFDWRKNWSVLVEENKINQKTMDKLKWLIDDLENMSKNWKVLNK